MGIISTSDLLGLLVDEHERAASEREHGHDRIRPREWC